MRKLLSLVFFSTLFFSFIADATVVRPTPRLGRSIWRNVRDSTPTPIENADATDDGTDLITINAPGQYQLYENITNKILITSEFVSLDLNGYEVAYDGNDLSPQNGIIQVEADNVAVFNGFVRNSNESGEKGIGVINIEKKNILFERLTIYDCSRGVAIQEGEGCELIDLNLIGNARGIYLSGEGSNILMDCTAIGGPGDSQPAANGFELENSNANCFYNCEALDMSSNYTTAGFKTTGGGTNLFYQCVAKGITTIETDFCSKAYGFWLTGEEEKTKIIDCIVNDISAEGDAVAYGIHLQPEILQEGDLLATTTASYVLGQAESVDVTLKGAVWSPNGRLLFSIANRGDSIIKKIIWGFDGSNLNPLFFVERSDEPHENPIFSPDGRYVASSFNIEDPTGSMIVIDPLDGVELSGTNTIVFDDSATEGSLINDLAWSRSGKYIAATRREIIEGTLYVNQVQVVSFDGQTLHRVSRSDEAGTDASGDILFRCVAWSPDERFIAAGKDDGTVKVYLFKGSNLLEELATLSISDGVINDLAWSPNGKFIAAGKGTEAWTGHVSVLSFETSTVSLNSTLSLVTETADLGEPIRSVTWSPDGKFIANTSTTIFLENNYVAVWSFDGADINFEKEIQLPAETLTVDWSSCGAHIAATTAEYTEGLDKFSYLYILDAMITPFNCLLERNTVSDVRAQSTLVGTGISGGCENCFFSNICCDNDVDFSLGVPNVFFDDHDIQRPFDNIATQRPTYLIMPTNEENLSTWVDGEGAWGMA